MNAAPSLRIAIIGAGWAGMAAAVRATELGHAVTVFEAARTLGGRARGVPLTLPDGREVMVDNGQHILIGAYAECLRLMQTVDVDPRSALLRLPLALRYPDGSGIALPDWPAPLDAVAGILGARGWSWRDKRALIGAALAWRRAGFQCDAQLSVAALCAGLPQRLRDEFIEPLCVSALNTPMPDASAQVFLRVLQDALFAARGGSNLLLPRVDLSALFPQAAARWVAARGGRVRVGQRVESLTWQAPAWQVNGAAFDRMLLATSASNAVQTAVQTAQEAPTNIAEQLHAWAHGAAVLQHRAITTVYAQAEPSKNQTLLRAPMLALRSGPGTPAQFVFERDAIAPPAQPTRLLAFVVSDSAGERGALEAAIAHQAQAHLSLRVTPLLTVTEKRATFACTPALARPPMQVAPGLLACGDYIEGPYPATLEGAVRSGLRAAEALR
ncbi:hydroxysqualene dehydroxylase HpnE [Ottowia testudinis]|uniref:FAD-dependent oxidoreductase n=1 Tax=Ottowia testudinis TaxID=2816950 RepID=A0A975CD84_9BURK|nr:hydroxysqualene dehydroxylase HpnE [Ottowia testudinis]QTD44255.1 FAD-dependent oxidoreductase [Ottowia testudinis]